MPSRQIHFATRTHNLVRLRHRDNPNLYLHFAAEQTTQGTDYAWLGTRAQADTLRTRFEIVHGADTWPYSIVEHEDQNPWSSPQDQAA